MYGEYITERTVSNHWPPLYAPCWKDPSTMTTTATAPQATVDTVETVPSFIMDAWWTPDDGSTGSAVPVRDASTGEILAKVSTEGLDLSTVVDYGRTTGQAELGQLTFHQR